MPRPNVETQRRHQIVSAGMQVFAERGLAGARMEDVAVEAGISKATIYLYYPSKDALVLAVIDEMYGGDSARMRAGTTGDNAESRLRNLAGGLAAASTEGAGLLPLVLEIYSLGARQDPIRSRLRAYFDAYRAEVANILIAGETSGELRCPTGPGPAALAVVAALEGVFWMWALADGSIDLAVAFDGVLDILLQGLGSAEV